jgi:ABC-type transport system substrate-binding protein
MNTKNFQLMSRSWLVTTALILVLLILGACSSAAPTTPQPAQSSGGDSAGGTTEESAPAEASSSQGGEKVLIVAVDGDIDTFDPCCTVGTKTSQTTIQNAFDQLTQYAQVEKTLPNGE